MFSVSASSFKGDLVSQELGNNVSTVVNGGGGGVSGVVDQVIVVIYISALQDGRYLPSVVVKLVNTDMDGDAD